MEAPLPFLGAASPAIAPRRAQLLAGEHCFYDVGPQASQPLQRHPDALPISASCCDSPGSRRLIAVNCKYICYGLPSSSSVCILGRNVASRGLFQGHSQRVTDIEFFAENYAHLVASVSSDGRLFVWRIVEDAGADDEFQLQQHIVLAIQFEGPWKHVQPRVCWHPQSQECLVMCISDSVFKIDVDEARTKASPFEFLAEAFLSCHTADLIDGILCIGHHDAEVTDVSVFFTDFLYVASASRDGMVRIWGGCKARSLAAFMPHEGQPVGCITFVMSSSQPDKAALLTSDITNKKLKLWVSATSSTCCTWFSVQTLEFTSCDGNFADQVFLNYVCTVPRAGLVLLGSFQTATIYCVHLEFGKALNAVRMNYIAEFSVSMPNISLTAVTETGSSCKDIAHVFCVQTQAIQEYFLNFSHPLSSQCNEPGLVSSSAALPRDELMMNVSICDDVEAKEESKKPNSVAKEIAELAAGNPGLTCEHNLVANPGSGFGSWVEVPTWIAASIKKNLKVGSLKEATDSKEKNSASRVSPLASGLGAGFIKPQMEEEVSFSCVSRNAGDVSTRPTSPPRLSMSSSYLNNSKMAEDVVLPGLVPLPCGPLGRPPGDTFLTVDKKQGEIARQEKKNINLQRGSTVSDMEAIADVCRLDTCSGAAVGVDQFRVPTESGTDHCKPGISQEHEEEGLVTPEMQGSSNSLKKKRTRRRSKGNNRMSRGAASMLVPNLAAEETSLLCKTQEYAMPGIPEIVLEDKFHITQKASPHTTSPQKDVSLQISAMQESLDQLLTSQMELQKNLYAVAEVPLSTETESMDALLEERINYYFGICLDSFRRQLNETWNSSNALQHEWTYQVRRVFKEFLAKENMSASTSMLKAEVLSLVGSHIGLLIASNVDNVLTTILPQILEGWSNKVVKYIEKSIEGILNRSVGEQVESIWIMFWKHLMQVERNYVHAFVSKLF